jgi:hypothetical protein
MENTNINKIAKYIEEMDSKIIASAVKAGVPREVAELLLYG